MSGRDRRRNPYRGADRHTQAAKARGYAARSVFKLEEINKRLRLLRQGQRVLDLGAAPGSWSAYACQHVGKRGLVVAVDLQRLTQVLPEHCTTLLGDAFDEGLLEAGPVHDAAPFDLVLSDMAPNTMGDRGTDQYRSFEVFMRALSMAKKVLKPGGAFVGKIFMSGHFGDAREGVRLAFEKVRVIRPTAVRDVSYEIFVVGMGHRPAPEGSDSEGSAPEGSAPEGSTSG